ncbi:MAG: gamma-glutamylcyclotransferase [Desulfovibrionaceae bacterium]
MYGTLKTGQCNHPPIAPGVAAKARAWTWGRLADMPEGCPMLFAPPAGILAHARGPAHADLATQGAARPPEHALSHAPGPLWRTVAGQVLYLDDPARWLPELDALEDFGPMEPSLYCRVPLPVAVGAVAGKTAVRACWAYISPHSHALAAHGATPLTLPPCPCNSPPL